jgi:hypothetical protein
MSVSPGRESKCAHLSIIGGKVERMVNAGDEKYLEIGRARRCQLARPIAAV